MAITRITRTSAKRLQVNMQDKPWQGHEVLVERRYGAWTVVQIRSWIA